MAGSSYKKIEPGLKSVAAVQSPIAFIDLKAQRRRLGQAIDDAVQGVFAHGRYILGPEVSELESQLTAFCGTKFAVTCSSGTDALALVLMAKAVGPGDAVFCPTFTFCATAEVVAQLGATPVFIDSDRTSMNMDPESLKCGISTARSLGLHPVGVIPVDLFGQPADYDRILPIAEQEGLWVLADAAQAFGAVYKGRPVGTLAMATTTSFFPAKPLGCYGDGGAVLTDDADLAAVIKSLRVHGQGEDKYDNVRIGMAARLDTIQAAILLQKLAIFADEIAQREGVAARYSEALADICEVPVIAEGLRSVWAQYTIKVPLTKNRDEVVRALAAERIPTAVYYPRPLHKQTGYRRYPTAAEKLDRAERLAQEVLSLPMHPYLEASTQKYIVDAVRRALS